MRSGRDRGTLSVPDPQSLNRRAKYYRLTRAGRKQLEREAREWEQTTEILARFLSPGEMAS